MGSTPHAHALAKVKHPCEQGSIAMISVFLDTFVVLTLTALVIITSGLFDNGLDGIELTQAAFSQVFGGFGGIFIAVCLLFFAFSTIVGWYFFGEQNIRYLFGGKGSKNLCGAGSLFYSAWFSAEGRIGLEHGGYVQRSDGDPQSIGRAGAERYCFQAVC